MEVKEIRIHTCDESSTGAITGKCRCRKYISKEKAATLIENGYAKNVIISVKRIDTQQKCTICDGLDSLKKSCQNCKSTGVVTVPDYIFEYGADIFMRPFLRTPRTATVEQEHIEYSVIEGDRDAAKRIELYNELNQLSLAELGAALIDSRTGEIVVEGNPEPKNDPKTATGRDYDYGRTI